LSSKLTIEDTSTVAENSKLATPKSIMLKNISNSKSVSQNKYRNSENVYFNDDLNKSGFTSSNA